MSNELALTAQRVLGAGGYLDLFGVCTGDSDVIQAHIKRIYRKLARVLFPDLHHASSDKELAQTAFVRLTVLYQEALDAAAGECYGQASALATVTSRKAEHCLSKAMAAGDLCDLYASTSRLLQGGDVRDTVCKVARSPADRDLMEAEVAAITKLRGPDGNPKLFPFVPELVDSFAHGDRRGPGPVRQANVLARLKGFYTLEQVRQAYPQGLNPLDMAWMWRRLLHVAGYAHRRGIIHGAVLPTHVVILPEQHGLVLVDWCYSSAAKDGQSNPPIKAVVDAYRSWYPEEVLKKEAPVAATDIAMAARCMIFLMAGNPETGVLPDKVSLPFRAFFRGCLSSNKLARPDDTRVLLQEFDELLQRLGPPYFPRRFRAFVMPSGIA